MLNKAKDYLRRRVRAMQRSGQYPLLLPHHTLTQTGLITVDGATVTLGPALKQALSVCDGRRTLGEVARQAVVPKAHLVKAQDDGLLLIWRSALPADLPGRQHHPHSIIVSPHLDDAALSCGGRMLGDQSMLVLNVFSQTAWWRFGHGAEDAGKIQGCRQMEEELVSRLSGATMQELGLPEALLRGYAMEDVFADGRGPRAGRLNEEVARRDGDASVKIRDAVAGLAREHPLAHWFVPLAVGDHIDHRLTRDAAVESLRAQNITSTHLHFYEDLPYAAKLGPAADFSKAVAGYTLREELLDIDELIGWKLELLRAYWSQFRWSELAELRAYAKAVGGDGAAEVTWWPGG